jgi:hypothetical protein
MQGIHFAYTYNKALTDTGMEPVNAYILWQY